MERHRQYRRAGILGGMGPAATIRLYEEITARTPARADQDHIPLVIESNPGIPDRTAALLAGGADPLPAMLESVRRLTAAGAEFIAIACNTAHAWYPAIAQAAAVPVLHLIRIAAEACRARLTNGGVVGLLATEGTVSTGLYQAALGEVGLRWVLPSQADGAELMGAIRLVKTGGAGNLQEAGRIVRRQASRLIDQGAQVILLGCTDLSVVLRDETGQGTGNRGQQAADRTTGREGPLAVNHDLPPPACSVGVPVVDSTVALADKIIEVASSHN
jgi:aspartate racemase